MNVLDNGKYRSKTEWNSSSSIPALVDITEQNEEPNGGDASEPVYKQSSNRRSSLGIFRKAEFEKNSRRRTSLANPFVLFGRKDSHKISSLYENAVKFEKSDGSLNTSQDDYEETEDRFHTSSPNADKSSSGKSGKFVYFNDSNTSIVSNEPDNEEPDTSSNKSYRRRSSANIKSERKKAETQMNYSISDISSIETDHINAYYQQRQKRHSWWNIFTNEPRKYRSRRASQDVSFLSQSADNLTFNQRRSKSRSVDHGLSAPFDIDALRSKVEGRFESIDRLNNEKKKSSLVQIPTTSYVVLNRDTLTSIAAKFETTPTELTHLNKLNSSFIYPGQTLQVPDKSASIKSEDDSNVSDRSSPLLHNKSADDDTLDGLKPSSSSPKPGHIERFRNEEQQDTIITQRFLKINVRHITDGQGVVGGVLLVTPNAVMFDPNVSDTLVIEHGPEAYGVIAPMELVVNAAIFHDIAHMRVGGNSSNVETSSEKVEIYYPKSALEEDKETTVSEELQECSAASASVDDTDKEASKSGEPEKENEVKEQDEKPEEEIEKSDDIKPEENLLVSKRTTLEERRKSLLDTHWAIPSRDRVSFSQRTSESEDSRVNENDDEPSASGNPPQQAGVDADNQLSKNFYHDSGIDICDSTTGHVAPIQNKKVYSDADIVLSSEWVPPKTLTATKSIETPSLNTTSNLLNQNVETGARKKTSSVSFSVEDDQASNQSQTDNNEKSDKKGKMLKRLSYPLAWVEGLTNENDPNAKKNEYDSAPNTGDSNQSVFSKVFSRRSSIGTFIRPHSSEGTHPISRISKEKEKLTQPKLDYRSMVSIDDMPELFVSFDKLIPRPAKACQDPPLYLRLRMGKPKGKEIPLPTTVMSYGKNKLRPEYWFSIPRNRVDELYRLIKTWVPHLYGELNELEINERGFELIQNDTDWTKEGSNKNDKSDSNEDLVKLSTESWEVLSMNDDYKKHALFPTGSFDMDFPVPDLIGQTEILTEDHREKLANQLPARAEGYSWSLVFSTSQHGFSLNSLYRKMQKLESPILIVIEDTEHNVFGALTSCSLHVSDHFYGTGESLLYKFNPNFQVFHWTGENMYFIKGNVESLSIGAGDGKFGLWLDGDLNQGRSQPCSTYGNETLSTKEDFVIKTLECWAFV
ncbi:hypothetical protein ACFFRR_009285 [Megaselia abdita]